MDRFEIATKKPPEPEIGLYEEEKVKISLKLDKLEAERTVDTARGLEVKAKDCVNIARRILPGANDALIEEMASALMFIPKVHRILHLIELNNNQQSSSLFRNLNAMQI